MVASFILLIAVMCIGCSTKSAETPNDAQPQLESNRQANKNYINPAGQTIEKRFHVPNRFSSEKSSPGSFAEYLRNLKVKPHGATVKYYNGKAKRNNSIYDAVIDLEIGNKNLHQCADAIMRLRAEYLWKNHHFEQIHFNFTNGFRVDYTEWMKGRRMIVEGNRTQWNDRNNPANSYHDFWQYLELIFTYAGTLSLSKELAPVDIAEIEIGDIFIQGGAPGHAIIVVDIALNKVTGEKIFLLAQSYMPAQEIHILKNNNGNHGPWYNANENTSLVTPEWTFQPGSLMRFRD